MSAATLSLPRVGIDGGSAQRANVVLLAVVSLGAFIIQPAQTLVLALLLVWCQPGGGSRGFLGLIVLAALYLSLINVTKVPESDLAIYLETFKDAQQLDLTSYLILNAREPLYYVLLYALANLPGVDGRVYIFLSTLLPYVIFGVAVLRLGTALRLERRALFSLLIFLLFFSQLFSLSAHLLRQFLASSLVMLFLSEQAVTGRRRWWLGFLGSMIHYSALPLLLLSLVQPLKRYSVVISVMFHATILILVYVLAVEIAPLMLDLPVLGMVFQRVANGQGAELDPLTLPALGMAGLFLAISLLSLASTSKRVLDTKGAARDWSVLLTTVTVCVIVLASSAQSTLSEIAIRYFFYLYFLIGLILVFLMVRVPITRFAMHGLAVLSLPLFFYKLAYGEWTFATVWSLLFEPAWMLWSHLNTTLS